MSLAHSSGICSPIKCYQRYRKLFIFRLFIFNFSCFPRKFWCEQKWLFFFFPFPTAIHVATSESSTKIKRSDDVIWVLPTFKLSSSWEFHDNISAPPPPSLPLAQFSVINIQLILPQIKLNFSPVISFRCCFSIFLLSSSIRAAPDSTRTSMR